MAKRELGKDKVDYDDAKFRSTPVQQMVASCSGALLTSFFVTPLDVVKIRLQAQQQIKPKCFVYCNGLMDHICSCTNPQEWYRRPGHFTGTIDAFVKITKFEGISSLWSGLGPTLVLALPTTILYFVSYEQIRYRLKDWYNEKQNNSVKEQPFWIPAMSGAMARTLAASSVSPLELIRTKIQSERLSYTELGRVLGTMVRNSGIFSLWKGLVPTLLRDVPFSAIYWISYESMKSTMQSYKGSSFPPTFGFSFLAGACAGSLAATVTTPFDVVKTRQQIDLGEKQILSDKPYKSKTTLQVIREIRSQNGFKGLFAGLVPRIVKVAPACAIMISTFEYSKKRVAMITVVKEQKSQKLTY